jgi:hypothetical protein
MTRNKSAFNFDKQMFGFNITETGVKSWTKSFKLGPFSQTINVNLKTGQMKGTTSLPGTGLAKRYDLPGLDALRTPDLPEFKRKPDMWTDD